MKLAKVAVVTAMMAGLSGAGVLSANAATTRYEAEAGTCDGAIGWKARGGRDHRDENDD